MSENIKVNVTIKNYTSEELYVKSEYLERGKWVQTPVNCKADHETKYAFSAEGAEGSATGIEGEVKYKVGDGDDAPVLAILFGAPYLGPKEFKAGVSGSKYVSILSVSTVGDDNSIVIDFNYKLSK